MAVVFGVSTVFATTVYCKMEHSWWTQDGAAVAVHYWGGAEAGTTWPGVRMTPVEGAEGTWSYDVPADVDGLMFVRVNGTGEIADWGAKTKNLTLPTDGKNLYTITNTEGTWGDPGCDGVWSVYGEEPVVAEVNYYLVGTMTEWAVVADDAHKFVANEGAEGEYKLTFTLAEGDSIKVVKVEEGQENVWFPAEAGNYAVDAAHAGEMDIYFRPNYDGGEDWHAGCIYVAVPETPQPIVEVNYYLVGTMTDWAVVADDAHKFVANAGAETEEFKLSFTFAEGDSIKVVKVEEGQENVWFPAEAGNYGIDADHAGLMDVYFRPNYDGGADWYAACIYVAVPEPQAIVNTAAEAAIVKTIENGQLVIIKNGVRYNAQGTIVR